MENIFTKRIIGLVVMVAVILLSVGFGNIASRTGKVAVNIVLAPSIAKSTIDGKGFRQGTIYISKGSHTFTASLNNFTKYSQTIKVSENTKTINISLTPINQAGSDFLIKNPTYQLQREAIGGLETQARASVAQTPLINLLPIVNIAAPYKIDYGQSSTRKEGTVILISGSSPEGRQKALQWIRSKGFDPTELEIVFNDFNNPLVPTATPNSVTSNNNGDGGE